MFPDTWAERPPRLSDPGADAHADADADADAGAPAASCSIQTSGVSAPLHSALWTIRPDAGGGPTLADLRPHLSPNEWERVSGFRDPAHAWSSAAARALLRVMLSHFHGGRPLDWHFCTEPGGRPHVDMTRPPFPLTEDTRPRFSLSHTRGLAACLVSVGRWPVGAELGVDAEWAVRSVPALPLARRFFHPDEADALAVLPDEAARRDMFMTVWTRKEAVLKALGLGIANHLSHYACLGEPVTVTGPAAMIGAVDAWRAGSENATPEHRLSWAIRGPGAIVDSESPPSSRPVDGAAWPVSVPAHRHWVGWPV